MATPIDPASVTTMPTDGVRAESVFPTAERSWIASPVGWSSIFAATAVTVGVWLVLHLFGIGLGLTAIEPDDASSLRRVGVGTGIWSLVAPLIALFIGGLVAGRVAPTINTLNAAIHGAVVWALAAIASLILLAIMVGSMVRGLAATGRAVGDVAGTTAGAVRGADRDLFTTLGIDENDLVAPVNKRLQEQGMPRVSPDSMRAAAREISSTFVRRGGSIDRATITDIIARRTELSRADAEQVATQVEQKIRAGGERGRELLGEAGETALQAAETTGKVVLVLSLMMIVGLGAAIGGSVLSVRRERREHVVLPRAHMR
ncbi:MAG TPA: hypothetical protein VFQ53_21355 [Kofleriaceae bacterium]|nr:hypothetical protein [Kofleriaceae bacterium]